MVFGFFVVSVILIKYKFVDVEKVVLRLYMLISDEDMLGYIDLLVKKYFNGLMSIYLYDMVFG